MVLARDMLEYHAQVKFANGKLALHWKRKLTNEDV